MDGGVDDVVEPATVRSPVVLYQASMTYSANNNLRQKAEVASTGNMFSSVLCSDNADTSFMTGPNNASRHTFTPSKFYDSNSNGSLLKVYSLLSPSGQYFRKERDEKQGVSNTISSDYRSSPADAAAALATSLSRDLHESPLDVGALVDSARQQQQQQSPSLTRAVARSAYFESVDFHFNCYEVKGTLTLHCTTKDVYSFNSINTGPEHHQNIHSLTRAVARRVFEIVRGDRNRAAMAAKQEELLLRKLVNYLHCLCYVLLLYLTIVVLLFHVVVVWYPLRR